MLEHLVNLVNRAVCWNATCICPVHAIKRSYRRPLLQSVTFHRWSAAKNDIPFVHCAWCWVDLVVVSVVRVRGPADEELVMQGHGN